MFLSTLPDHGMHDWREPHFISLAWCQRTSGLQQAFAQSDLHQTSTIKHLTYYANVTLGSSILAKFLQILHKTLYSNFFSREPALWRETLS